jgi:hypothetical protein
MGFYIPEDSISHSHRDENLKSYIYVIVCGVMSLTTLPDKCKLPAPSMSVACNKQKLLYIYSSQTMKDSPVTVPM